MVVPKEQERKRKKLKAYQWRKLKAVLGEVLATNKFYKKKFAKVGIRNAEDIGSWEDFKKLPFTTREELLEDQEKTPPFGTNLTSPKEKYFTAQATSGTTSKSQLFVCLTEEAIKENTDITEFRYRQLGVGPKDRIYLVVRTFPTYYIEAARRLGAVSVVHEAHDLYSALVNIIKLQATAVYSTPSNMLELAEIAKREKINLLKVSQVKKIFLAGETLLPAVRRLIENIWQADCYNVMGSVEAKTFAAECLNKGGPHLFEKFAIFEVINPDSGKENQVGELVITRLWNLDCPLIRYRTGDLVGLDWRSCPCQSLSPKIKDGIIRRKGSRLNFRGLFFFPDEIEDVLRKYSGLEEYLIELKKINGVDQIEMKIEMSFAREKQVIPRLTKELGERFNLYPRKIISVAPGTLPRSTWKSKRIIDNRLISENESFWSDDKIKEFLSWQNLGRKLARKILYVFFR